MAPHATNRQMSIQGRRLPDQVLGTEDWGRYSQIAEEEDLLEGDDL